MDEKTRDAVVSKLDTIIKLMVLLTKGDCSLTEQMGLLSAAGLQPKEIAETLGTTPNAVRVTLSTMRKQKRKK